MSNFPQLTLNKLQELAEQENLELRQEELKKLMQPVPPFAKNRLGGKHQAERIKKSKNDFWYFDKTYFPASLYVDYARPGKFHKELVEIAMLRDKKAHIIHGPRTFGKTLTYKKFLIWIFLFGKRKMFAVGSSILPTAKFFLLDLIYTFDTNERIVNDFKLEWLEKSMDSLFARSEVNPTGTFVIPLSEERSSKGAQRMMQRLDFVYLTDFENETVSLTKEAIEKRITRLNEMRTSLSDNGTLVWEGNNFALESAMNQLFLEEEKGILSENFVMHKFAAWNEKRINQKCLWFAKYPAKSESELRKLCKPKDDYDWAGNFQGTPRLKSGDIFPDTFYQEWSELPPDVVSVNFVDPNTSLKSKGDTTAMGNYGFSPSTQNYYLTVARCRSYFKSNDLLTDLALLQQQATAMGVQVITTGMDGNVTQESVWTNNIINFEAISGLPFIHVKFRRYNIDQLATNTEDKYKSGKIFFPPGFSQTEEGKEFLKQFFGFRLKKANKKDDAPDMLISADTLLTELGLTFVTGSNLNIKSISNRRVKRI